MKFQDYYEVLGVERDADEKTIKKAYRRLALEWHPDRHQGGERDRAEAKFKRISEAYEVLSDPAKRKKYDRFGQHWKQGEEFTPPSGQRTMTPEEFRAAFGGAGGFSDFFQEIFGDQMRREYRASPGGHARYRYRGSDVRAELHLPVAEALAGGKRSFEVPALASCGACGGTGFLGQHVCPTCAGVGQVHKRQTVELVIPADVRDGMKLRLRGLGEPGEGGGAHGDLHLHVRLLDDELHRVLGNDLEVRVVLAPWDAYAGTRVDVRTARGTVTLSVPQGSRAGKRLRLRSQGFADGHGGHGDCYARIEMDLPERLSKRQEELLGELRAASSNRGDPHPGGLVSDEELYVGDELFLSLETVARVYELQVVWLREVYDHGLLGPGVDSGTSVFLAVTELDRVALVVRLRRLIGPDVRRLSHELERFPDAS